MLIRGKYVLHGTEDAYQQLLVSQEPFAVVFALLYACDSLYHLLFWWKNLESSIHLFKCHRNL